MIQSPDNYFKSIYKNTQEAILCIDENLRIFYISDAFRYNYDFNIKNDVMANCCMASNYLPHIKNCVSNQISDSFIFKNILSNLPKKCLIIPTRVNDKKFASIFLIDIDLNGLETIKANEIHSYIANNEVEIRDLASTVIMYSRSKNKKFSEDLKTNILLRCALKLRQKFEELTFISEKGIKSHNYYLLQVSEYILRTEQLAKQILGDDRINFTNDFANGIIVTEFRYDSFDILMSNAFSLLLQNTEGKVNLYVRNGLHKNGSFIIITKDESKCDELEAKLHSGISQFHSVANIKTIAKVLNSYQGILVVDKDDTNGFSIGFTLPPMPKRVEILRQPPLDKAKEHPELSIFGSMLSEFIEKN